MPKKRKPLKRVQTAVHRKKRLSESLHATAKQAPSPSPQPMPVQELAAEEAPPPRPVVFLVRLFLLLVIAYAGYQVFFNKAMPTPEKSAPSRSERKKSEGPRVALQEKLEFDGVHAIRGYSGWGEKGPRKNKSISGGPLKIKGKEYSQGIGTHAPSEIVFSLNGRYRMFSALAGVDEVGGSAASVVFWVAGDGKKLFGSKVLTVDSDPVSVHLDVTGVQELTLGVDPYDTESWDQADWVNLKFEKSAGSASK